MEKLKKMEQKMSSFNVSGPFHSKFLTEAEERLRQKIENFNFLINQKFQ